MAKNTPKSQNEIISLSLDYGTGRISNALSKAIAYERTPSFFDEEYIKERDEDLRQIQELKEKDSMLRIERKDKPVVLTSYQSRIIHALSYGISQEINTSEDIQEKIQNIRGTALIRRVVNITAFTAFLFGSARKRYKDIVIKELSNLAKTRQVILLGSGENLVKMTAPLIMIGETIEDLSPEKRNNLDFIEVIFGSAFFYELSNRFAIITPKLFEVWNKGGRGTELFSVLLSSIFHVYWKYRQTANKAEEYIRNSYKKKTITTEELIKAITEARREAMTYELNVSRIKQRVKTNYDSSRAMKRKFWIDLQNAIDGFKELDLIKEAVIHKGAKGQEKVSFILSDTYNFTEVESAPQYLLKTDAKSNNLSAF